MSEEGPGLTLEQFSALLDDCIAYIEATCIGTPGVYRIPGSMKHARELHAKYARGEAVDLERELYDPLTATTLLKIAIRGLQEPLVPQKYYPLLRALDITRVARGSIPPRAIRSFYKSLPRRNKEALRVLLHHIQRVAEVPENNMDLTRLLMVLGPTCLLAYREDPYEEMTVNPAMLLVLSLTIDDEGGVVAEPSSHSPQEGADNAVT